MPDIVATAPISASAPPAAPATVDASGKALKTSAFKVPGAGNSATISVVTVVVLLVLWFLVTNLGWVKPLFLPSPQAVFQQFYEYLTGQANDKPLWQHFAASMFRVFSAFAREACKLGRQGKLRLSPGVRQTVKRLFAVPC